MPLAAGSRLGSYEILAPLGAGGMGEVYRARDTKLAREVAIKVLPQGTAGDPAALARFEREAKAVAALSHPNILAIHDFGTSNGVTYAVMELLHGETLRQRLGHGAVAQKRAVEIAREIALGLAAAHERGVVHRDLKPENLFLTKDGLVKILDFGLARQLSTGQPGMDKTLTDPSLSGVVLGTAGYMSPEQVRGATADHRSDIFAFGAVLYEMLSGKRAFHGETAADTMSAILTKDAPPLSASGREISPGLERIVGHCLEKKPEERFQSARDLAFDLGTLSTDNSASRAAAETRSRSRWPLRAAVAVGAAALVALAFWAGERREREERWAAPPTFRRLTFRRGDVVTARFTPDGSTAVYTAAWEGKAPEIFSVRTDSTESRSIGAENALVLAVSSQGEIAIHHKRPRTYMTAAFGTVARLPLSGGAPRDLLEETLGADWDRDGKQLAVVRASEGKLLLEYPLGRMLYASAALEAPVRVSPDGTHVAAVEFASGGYSLLAFDRAGGKQVLATYALFPNGFAWSPDSREVYFVGGNTTGSQAILASSLSGRQRVILPIVGMSIFLHDVTSDGRLLLERTSRRRVMVCGTVGDAGEREIAWRDGASLRGVTDDGSLLFSDVSDSVTNTEVAYLVRCDGSQPVRLGEGSAMDISRDGRWLLLSKGSELVLLPTGAGVQRKVDTTGIDRIFAHFTPDGNRIAIWHADPQGEYLLSLIGVEGGPPRAVPIPGSSEGWAFSYDGKDLVYQTREGGLMMVPLSGGEPRPVPGPPSPRYDDLSTWSRDGKFLYFGRIRELPGSFQRREIATGKISAWLELQPSDMTGVIGIVSAGITPDGRSYGYEYSRVESSELYVASGLK